MEKNCGLINVMQHFSKKYWNPGAKSEGAIPDT